MKKLITLLVSLMAIMPVMAVERVKIDNLYYYLDENKKTATVTYLSWDSSENKDYVYGSLTIPSSVKLGSVTYSVTAIYDHAFYGCSGLTGNLIIPNSVQTIGDDAFSGCAGFTGSLTIPNSVTSIGNRAFYECSGFTGSLTIGQNVQTIGEGAFYRCSGFTGSLNIPNSVQTIGWYSFYECSGFTGSLIIGQNVQSIGERAFYKCYGFTGSLNIPNSVQTIGILAFYECSGFTGSLTIPNSVISIGNSTFNRCSGFNGTLTIGDNVQTIGESAFYKCSGFTGSLTIPNSVTSIGNRAFYECSGFTGSLTIGQNVQTIGQDAFYKCSGFTGSLIIPNSVTSIGSGAFYECSGFTGSLTIGQNVQSIDGYTFYRCNGFTGSLNIPNSVQTIGWYSFYECSGFTGSLIIGQNVQSIGTRAFYNCSGFMGSLTIGQNVQSIGESAFHMCSGFTGSLTIPNSVTSIESSAFSYCSSFDGTLTLPNSLQTIEDNTFAFCSGFTGSLTIPNSVTSIESSAFYYCSSFDGTLTLPNSLQTIGEMAFSGCAGFTGSLTIPNSVTSIGEWSFHRCSGFNGTLTLPNNIQTIGDFAFYGCRSFTGSLNIPNSVQTIGGYSFYECSGFTGSLIIGQNVQTIGERAFYHCYGFTGSLTIPNSVQTIGDGAFTSCEGFSEVLSLSINPPAAGSGSFSGLYSKPLFVPAESVPIYKTAYEWENFKYINRFPVEATGISLNKSELPLLVGQEETLIATLTPQDATTEITWKSDNEAVATVTTDGAVTALAIGTANITAIAGSVSAICNVTVNPVEASSVELNVQDITLLVGQTDKLKATVYPVDTTNPVITWKSDNDAVASVSTDGTVIAVSIGIANITATCGTVSATCKVTVNPVEATSIEISLQDVTLLIGSTMTLTAKVYPDNVTNQVITWISSNPKVASINASGTITALQEGVTVITASCGNASATCKVTVTPVSPSSIELNIKDMILFIGQSETIQAIVRPANTTYPSVTWQSEDESVATVSANGKVTGLREGTTNITAKCGEVSASCKVTVNPIPASNIAITTGDVTLTIGSSTDLIAKVSPENTTHPEVEWLSSDPNIATITPEGTVTAKNIGTAIITAKCGNVSATCTVTVIPILSEGIVVSPTSVSMLLGDNLTLTATVFPENTTDKNVKWGSDNPSVASVSTEGVVKALNIGKATITASNGTAEATCEVTVNPVVATGISLNVKDETIFVDSYTQLVATISPSNVTDNTITWTSSKPEIATVSDNGKVYGVAVGTTTITATIGSVSASCQINVVHRIPDMDPSVTTSDRDIVTISGHPVNMAVYVEGGEPSGWSFVWTKNGETVSTSSELNLTVKNETEGVIAEIYRVKVENEIDKVVILSEVFDFVVQIYPGIEGLPDGAGITVATGDSTSGKTREGNTVTLSVTTPKGGYPEGWEYLWSDQHEKIGEGETLTTVATMSPGNSMAIEKTTYRLEMTNYSPEGEEWARFNLESELDVYRRPLTPVQMLRKGDGTSHTFVAMIPLTDAELEQLDYRFVYGWTDSEGMSHIMEQTEYRYCHTTGEIYNNPTNRFWVYSVWNYQDGSVVSSGLCYLDGTVDESFDASVFDGNGLRGESEVKTRTAVYTLDGQYVGSDPSRLAPGIYITTSESHGVMKTQKIIIR